MRSASRVIMFIDIPIVHELGITACIGVLLMIVTNKMILPIILTRATLEESCKRHHANKKAAGTAAFGWLFKLVAALRRTERPPSRCSVSAWSLLVVATVLSRDMVIGDLRSRRAGAAHGFALQPRQRRHRQQLQHRHRSC